MARGIAGDGTVPAMARRVLGLVIVAVGAYLVANPRVVADALALPHATPTQWINLRASWGGTLVGLGAFVAWLPALRPWPRTVLGLLGWAMAGIAVARLVGFAVDGSPDARQYIWITAEVLIAGACALIIARRRR
jgi:uncharacterized protein DUF4345